MNPSTAAIAIVDAGVMTAAGDTTAAALTAVLNSRRCGVTASRATATTPDGQEAHPEVALASGNAEPAPSGALVTKRPELGHTPTQRIIALARLGLGPMARRQRDRLLAGHGLALVAIPGESTSRHFSIERAALEHVLQEMLPNGASVELQPQTASAVAALQTAREALKQGRADWVVVGGVDSLIDRQTLRELAAEERLAFRQAPDGRLPGEAAGFVLLAKAQSVEGDAPLLIGVAAAEEPNTGRADSLRLRGLVNAIQQATAEAGAAPAEVQSAWAAMGYEVAETLEWCQVGNALWPARAPDAYREAMELGLMHNPPVDDPAPALYRSHTAFGDVGAATLPVLLALACEGLSYERTLHTFDLAEAPSAALVLETGDRPHRGAVFIAAKS